jgi:signal recognition particle receptor subunit alpha
MLEQLLIFTRGGLILWSCKELSNALKGSPIDTLIRSCLLEERSGAASYNYDAPGASYSLKWTFHNDLGLVFVAVYQRILHLLYVDDLLAAVKREFSQVYDPTRTVYRDFDEIFKQLKIEAEARAEDLKKSNPVIGNGQRKQQVAWKGDGSEGKKNGGGSGGGGGLKNDGDGGKKGDKSENNRFVVANNNNSSNLKSNGGNNVSVNGKENDSVNNGAFDVNRLQKKVRNKGGNGKKTDNVVSKAEPKKVIKKNRVWDEKPPETKLDFTDHVDVDGDADKDRKVDFFAKEQGESMMDKDEILSSDSEDEEEEDDEDDSGKNSKPDAKKKGWFSSMFQR